MKRLGGIFAVICVGAATFGVGLASPAAAVALPCGATILADTTLTADVGPCPTAPDEAGIFIGANNITLNLNGFSVIGDSTPIPNCCPAIQVVNRQGVRILNGTVRGFSTGIYMQDSSGNTISGVIARDNVGMRDGNSVLGEGIQLFRSHNNRITSTQLLRNGTFSGINLYDSGGNTVQGNSVQANNIIQINASHGGPTINQDIGIWVISLSGAGLSRNNVITRNSVTQSGLDGIQVSRFSVLNTITQNNVSSNGFYQAPGIRDGDGIAVFAVNNLIQSNSVSRNAANGIGVRAPGTQVGPGNRMLRNSTGANGSGPNPSPAFDLFDGAVDCGTSTWSGNTFQTNSPPCTGNP